MQNLLDFLRKYSFVFLFFILETISLALLFRFNSYQGSVWFSSANAAVATVDRWYAEMMSYFYLHENNARLTSRLAQLQLENSLLRKKMQDAGVNTTIADSIMRVALADYTRIPAIITSNSTKLINNYLVIDRGSADGVRPEMGVIAGTGVVGIVYLCGAHYSLVIPVINKKSSISCRVRGQAYFGYLQWDGRSPRKAYVDDIPRYAKFKVGDKIETSGYSAVFPPGILVGTISKIENAPDGQSFRLLVDLSTDFSAVRDVSVITTPYKQEVDTLRTEAAHLDSLTNL